MLSSVSRSHHLHYRCLRGWQHPNIADILDVYFQDGNLCIVGEHLELSLFDLGFKRLVPEEWEVATIIAEVIKAMTYLLDTLPTCENHIDSSLTCTTKARKRFMLQTMSIIRRF
ncbi:hypothetical protein BJ878DRAFT_263822 [Calycina marina]|uniref:Protein kinase domain-containing protein n=1 Tax=Calycina marina TaxID=1763456 RepID=A0A9P7YW14_9HELO|nr:hypothetical protein BJ878DRAFT_263822 [Calycina marina]